MKIKQTFLLLVILMVFTACGDNILSVLDEPESYDVNVTKEELVGTWVLAERTKKEYMDTLNRWYLKLKSISKNEYQKRKKYVEKGYFTLYKNGTLKYDSFAIKYCVSNVVQSKGTWRIAKSNINLELSAKNLDSSYEEFDFRKIDGVLYLYNLDDSYDMYKETYYVKKVAKGVVK